MTADRGAPAGRPARAAALAGALAGAVGGAVAGLGDGLYTALAGSNVGARWVAVPLASLGLWGAAGVLAASVVVMLAALIARLRPQLERSTAGALAATVLSAPLVVHDALAMFGGGRASRIPGRLLISLALAAAGLALTFLAARRFAREVAALESTAAPAGKRRAPLAVLAPVLALVLAAGLHVANRVVLPRLYPWFHLTLALALVLVLVLGVRLWLAAVAPRPRLSLAALAALALIIGPSVALGLSWLRQSHTLLFVAHQRTQLLSLALDAVPLSAPRRRPPPTRSAGGAQELPPLPPGPRRPSSDIVIITIDALRADHVGAYGYSRPTTPNIDALARRGVRFERAYAQAPHTSFSVTSMLTGKYYPTLTRLEPTDGQDTLALFLRRYGWKTAAFYPESVFFVQGDKLKAYDQSAFQFEYVKKEYLDAHAQISKIAEFFATEKPERAFLWVHFFDPHEPYDKWPDHDFGPRDIDRYDSEIAYTDAAVGRLLRYLEKERPQSIVVLTADHGEEFDDHGGRYHGKTLYDEQIRVPFIIAVPGVPPAVVKGPAELVDVAPTLLGLLDIPIPVRMRGTDLGPWLASPSPPTERLGLAFAEVDEMRMVASAHDKLLCDVDKGFCAYHDLATDPREQRNLAEARPERVNELRTQLDDWLAGHLQFEPARRSAAGDMSGLAGGEAKPQEARLLERARLGEGAVAAELAGLLERGASPAVRREAARLLATHLPPRPETSAELRKAAAAADPELAAWAAVASVRLGDRQAATLLEKRLTAPGSSEVELRVQMALALVGRTTGGGDAGAPTVSARNAALPVLVAALPGCKDPALCRRIIEALGAAGDRRATPVLLAHLESVLTRREVVAALARLADPASVQALRRRLLEDEYVPVRAEAARALAAIGGTESRRALTEAAASEREPQVKAAIRQALTAASAARP